MAHRRASPHVKQRGHGVLQSSACLQHSNEAQCSTPVSFTIAPRLGTKPYRAHTFLVQGPEASEEWYMRVTSARLHSAKSGGKSTTDKQEGPLLATSSVHSTRKVSLGALSKEQFNLPLC